MDNIKSMAALRLQTARVFSGNAKISMVCNPKHSEILFGSIDVIDDYGRSGRMVARLALITPTLKHHACPCPRKLITQRTKHTAMNF
jgi:hypothetical protein